MLRLITFLCLIHLSIETIIRGRILLNGDVKQVDNVPAGSQLMVRLEDSSIADAPEITLKEIEISNLVAFPINYQIQVPANVSSTLPHTLSARIKKGDILLYINEQSVPVTINTNDIITIDIPVIIVRGGKPSQPLLNNFERLSWPELVGREGTYAVQYIKEKTGLTNVFTLPEGSIVTMDYRTDRVRVYVNKDGIVTQTPHTG